MTSWGSTYVLNLCEEYSRGTVLGGLQSQDPKRDYVIKPHNLRLVHDMDFMNRG